jgi:hypothetical protein
VSDEIRPGRFAPFDVEEVAAAYAKLAEMARAGEALPVDVSMASPRHKDQIELTIKVTAYRRTFAGDPVKADETARKLIAIGVGLQGRRP